MHRHGDCHTKGLKIQPKRAWCRSCDRCLHFNPFNISGGMRLGRWGKRERAGYHASQDSQPIFTWCLLNLFGGCGTLTRRGRYVMLRITLLSNVLSRTRNIYHHNVPRLLLQLLLLLLLMMMMCLPAIANVLPVAGDPWRRPLSRRTHAFVV